MFNCNKGVSSKFGSRKNQPLNSPAEGYNPRKQPAVTLGDGNIDQHGESNTVWNVWNLSINNRQPSLSQKVSTTQPRTTQPRHATNPGPHNHAVATNPGPHNHAVPPTQGHTTTPCHQPRTTQPRRATNPVPHNHAVATKPVPNNGYQGSKVGRKTVRFRQTVARGAHRPTLKHSSRPPHSHARLSLPFSARMICMVRTIHLRDGDDGFIYDRATEWGRDFPAANGTRQSPIDFMSGCTKYDEALAISPLTINYCTSRETDILNNGQNLVMFPKSKGAISGGPLPLGHEFELAEIRFHWGSSNSRGSEHRVNGKAFPMEVQYIHWNASLYSSMEDACGKPDGTAALCLFVQIGRENATVKSLVSDALGDVIFKGRQKTTNTPFNPVCLLPDPDLRDYWSYEGSLTFPPCHENTTWIMLRYPLLVSPGQIEEFRRLLCYSKGDSPAKGSSGRLVDNFRPVQPLNGRVVRASFR